MRLKIQEAKGVPNGGGQGRRRGRRRSGTRAAGGGTATALRAGILVGIKTVEGVVKGLEPVSKGYWPGDTGSRGLRTVTKTDGGGSALAGRLGTGN